MDFRQRRLRFLMRLGTRTTIPIYRMLGGRGASLMSPRSAPPVCLLTTTGRRSGKERTVSLSYIEDDEGPLVVGSNGGLPWEPAWVLNLRARPEAILQVRRDRARVRATFVEGDAAGPLRAQISAAYPDSYGRVFEQATRDVPIIRLTRV